MPGNLVDLNIYIFFVFYIFFFTIFISIFFYYNSNFVHGLYGQNRGIGYPFKSSFLSTNTNSNNQSGQKIDSSPSNESGKSAPYLDKFNKLQYNNSMVNIDRNNTFVFPFTGITPEGIKHIYTNSFNSNERLFRQPFSSNRTYNKKTDNKFNNN